LQITSLLQLCDATMQFEDNGISIFSWSWIVNITKPVEHRRYSGRIRWLLLDFVLFKADYLSNLHFISILSTRYIYIYI
jgi:hypothetical protein